MSDWMFDDGSAEALLNQDYTPPVPPVWDEPEPQGAPSQDPLFGDDPPVDEVDEVVVTGYSGGGNDYGGGGGGGAGGGNWPTDTTSLDPEGPDDDLPCTPPPDGPTPAGVDVDHLRRTARDMANEAKNLDRDQEWAGIVWRDTAGQLHRASLNGSGSDQEASFPIGQVGNGGVIVAIFHTHPDRDDGTQQGRLHRRDIGILGDLADAGSARGITVDANAMSYVNANSSNPMFDRLHEFDKDEPVNGSGTLVGHCGGGAPLGS